jgi:hypothetical protein
MPAMKMTIKNIAKIIWPVEKFILGNFRFGAKVKIIIKQSTTSQ